MPTELIWVIPYEGGTLWHPTSPISLYYGYIKSGNELGGNPEWFCDISNGSREDLCWMGGVRGDLNWRENRIYDYSYCFKHKSNPKLVCVLGEVPPKNVDVWFIVIMKSSCQDITNGMLQSPIGRIFIEYKVKLSNRLSISTCVRQDNEWRGRNFLRKLFN